jgi:hypothetical protein
MVSVQRQQQKTMRMRDEAVLIDSRSSPIILDWKATSSSVLRPKESLSIFKQSSTMGVTGDHILASALWRDFVIVIPFTYIVYSQ